LLDFLVSPLFLKNQIEEGESRECKKEISANIYH